jgi:hypothetical protein
MEQCHKNHDRAEADLRACPELRKRAVRMVFDTQDKYSSPPRRVAQRAGGVQPRLKLRIPCSQVFRCARLSSVQTWSVTGERQTDHVLRLDAPWFAVGERLCLGQCAMTDQYSKVETAALVDFRIKAPSRGDESDPHNDLGLRGLITQAAFARFPR